MDPHFCVECHKPGEFICFCAHSIFCIACIGKHFLKNPSVSHKPVALKDQKLRNLVNTSLTQLKAKESEILTEASTVLATEKLCKLRIEQEIQSISRFCESSILKIQNFIKNLKNDIDETSEVLISNVKKSCEDYMNLLQNDSGLLETLKIQGSQDLIEKFEITSSICTLSGINMKKLLNESLYLEIGLQTGINSNQPSFGLSSISITDVSQSLDSQLWKKARTRVPTKVNKKSQNLFLFSSDDKKLRIFHSVSKEKDSFESDLDSKSVCTLTTDGSLLITGGIDKKTAYLFDINERKIEQVSDMSTIRSNHAAVSLADYVYVIGGRTSEGISKSCERFDLIQKSWQGIGDLMHGRERHSACVYRGRIFVAGGIDISTLEVFNTVSNKFSTLRTILSVAGPCLMFPVEDFMIIFHGNSISSFDPAKFTCQSLTSLTEDDWYISGNVQLNQKTASFIKSGNIFNFDVESGDLSIFK